MANKKQKQSEENTVKQPTKQEKEMFSLSTCAHDNKGNPVNWMLIRSLCKY